MKAKEKRLLPSDLGLQVREDTPKSKVRSQKPFLKGISVVIPAYNEEDNIDRCLGDVIERLTEFKFPGFEVILIDDGSTDRTLELALEWAARDGRIKVIGHPVNLGYAKALKSGFEKASEPLVFYTDSDNQFDLRELKLLLDHIDENDIVTGFRVYRFDPLTRLVLSWGFNLLVRIIFRIRAKDIDCAFKLFRREIIERIHIESTQFFVDAEMLAKARYLGYRIHEVPVRHYPRSAGRSTIRPTHILYTLRELARMWINIYIRKRI